MAILKTKFGKVDSDKIMDVDYRKALEIGVSALIEQDKLVYAEIREDKAS